MNRVADLARAVVGRRRPPAPIYLVSTAGHPNYGDELIARAWLDHLAVQHPDAEVWLDCPHPGRAAHLFAGAHPRARFTSTLWEVVLGSAVHDPEEDDERIGALIRDLGSPRVDAGLLALRGMGSVHLLGGGYLNSIWQDNLGLVSAAVHLKRSFGTTLFATGQGFMPLEGRRSDWLRERLSHFDVVEARDEPSAAIAGGVAGIDDAFLALANRRPVFDPGPTADSVVLVQGDLRAWADDDMLRTIDSFLGPDGDRDAAFVEAIPPDDVHFARLSRPDAPFLPFGRIWTDGFPARRGQRWLTSRFHAHLLGAAAGAAGLVVSGRPGYYDVKHDSLFRLGTGWSRLDAGEELTADGPRPTVDPAFPDVAKGLASSKRSLAERLYPV